MRPINQVAGIQVRIVTSCAFSELRDFASFMTQIAAQIHPATEATMSNPWKIQHAPHTPNMPAAAAAAAGSIVPLGLGAGVDRWAKTLAARTRRGRTLIARFMRACLGRRVIFCQRESGKPRGRRVPDKRSPQPFATAAAIEILRTRNR